MAPATEMIPRAAVATARSDMVAEALSIFCSSDSTDAVPLALVLETRRQQLRKANSRKKKATNTTDTCDSVASVDEQLCALPRKTLHEFCDVARVFVEQHLSQQASLSDEELLVLEAAAAFATILVLEEKQLATVDQDRVLGLVTVLHGHLLRLKGEPSSVQNAQDAISALCEAVWTTRYTDDCNTMITQMLPYLIVRSYDAQNSDHFASKRHPIRRLYIVRDALLELDFQDDSSGLLRDILLRCFIQPNFFRSPDAVAFLGFLFEFHVPFILDINATIRNQIPNQRKSILKKFGAIYFKAWVGNPKSSKEDAELVRACIEEECIQRYVHDAVHASSLSLFAGVRTVLQVFFDNKRHAGVDEMLYRISSPILWRGVKAANDSVRRQAAVLLFDNFPLRDPNFNNELLDRALQKQFDAFEDLLGDSHPAVRIAAIHGVAKVLSVYWELLPAETIRCFISKLVVDLVNDVSSSGVRAAVFEALQFILDNHNSHAILKPLLPMLAPLINDRNERVRAEFAALLVRIKSIRNLHFYDVVAVDDLLDRLIKDCDSVAVCKQLVLLFFNSYFPQGVGGSSQVARCLALVKKNPEAAMVFYSHVAEHASVGSVCKLAALLCRCSLNFVAKRLKALDDGGNSTVEDGGGSDTDDGDEDDESFSDVGSIVVLEIMACLIKSVHVKVLNDERFAECKSFLAQQVTADTLETLLLAYGQGRPFDQEALSAIWQTIGYLGELSEGELLEPLVERLMAMNSSCSKKLLDSMIDCLSKWHQLPFLVAKIEDVLAQWREDEYVVVDNVADKKQKSKMHAAYRLQPTVALNAAEYIIQSMTQPCPKHLMDRLVVATKAAASPLLELDVEEVTALCRVNAFGVLRLLEVHAKLLVLTESTSVAQQTSALLDAAKTTSTSNHKDALAELQPSAFFSPPLALAKLLDWIGRLLLVLRVELVAGIEKPGKANGKRRRGGGGEAERNMDADTQLVGRWRNLFSLVALLATECVAFGLQREGELRSVEEFVTCVVDALCASSGRMEVAERAVVFHACHLLAFLDKTEKSSMTRGTGESSSSSTADALRNWTADLKHAMQGVYNDHRDKCEDLLTPIASLLRMTVEDEQEEQDDEEEGRGEDEL